MAPTDRIAIFNHSSPLDASGVRPRLARGLAAAVGGLADWVAGVGEAIGAFSPTVVRFGVPALVIDAGLAIAAWSYRSTIERVGTYTISS